jgi:hypothetical protein
MRLIVSLMALAFALHGEDKPKERPLTDAEVQEFQLTMAQISLLQTEHDIAGYQELSALKLTSAQVQLLRKRFDIEEYERDIAGPSEKQMKMAQAACESIGIPKEKMQSDCVVTVGSYPDGKPILDATGQPIKPRVWSNKPDNK